VVKRLIIQHYMLVLRNLVLWYVCHYVEIDLAMSKKTIIYDCFEYVIGDLFCVVFLFSHYALASDGCYLDISMTVNIQPILIICDLRN